MAKISEKDLPCRGNGRDAVLVEPALRSLMGRGHLPVRAFVRDHRGFASSEAAGTDAFVASDPHVYGVAHFDIHEKAVTPDIVVDAEAGASGR